MVQCIRCKKKPTRTRILTDGVCNECIAIEENERFEIDYGQAPFNQDDALGDVNFKNFVEWVTKLFSNHVTKICDNITSQYKKISMKLKKT